MLRLLLQVTLMMGTAGGSAYVLSHAANEPLRLRPVRSGRVQVRVVSASEDAWVRMAEGPWFRPRESQDLRLPLDVEVRGRGTGLLLRHRGTRIAFDEGAQASVGLLGQRWPVLLEVGRIRVQSTKTPVRVTTDHGSWAGTRLGVWARVRRTVLASGAPVMVLEPKEEERTIESPFLASASEAGFTSGPTLLRLLELPQTSSRRSFETSPHVRAYRRQDDGSRLAVQVRPDGTFAVVLGPSDAVEVHDAAGRWAVPGDRFADLERAFNVLQVARTFLDRPRPVFTAGTPSGAEPESDGAVEPPKRLRPKPRAKPAAPSAKRQRPRARTSTPAKPKASNAEASEAEDSEDPPDSLEVDWTRIGRPTENVLDSIKQETPAPSTP